MYTARNPAAALFQCQRPPGQSASLLPCSFPAASSNPCFRYPLCMHCAGDTYANRLLYSNCWQMMPRRTIRQPALRTRNRQSIDLAPRQPCTRAKRLRSGLVTCDKQEDSSGCVTAAALGRRTWEHSMPYRSNKHWLRYQTGRGWLEEGAFNPFPSAMTAEFLCSPWLLSTLCCIPGVDTVSPTAFVPMHKVL